MKSDITVEIMKDIRTSVREIAVRVDETNARLDETNARLDQTNARILESEVRASTAITALAGTVREVVVLLREQNELRPRVERCEVDIAELKQRIPA